MTLRRRRGQQHWSQHPERMYQSTPLGFDPETLARMAEIGSRERREARYRDAIKTRCMREEISSRRKLTIEQSIDAWRPAILECDGTVQP